MLIGLSPSVSAGPVWRLPMLGVHHLLAMESPCFCRIRACEFGTCIDYALGGFLCWMHQICPANCGRYGTGQPDLLPKALKHAEGMNDIATV